MSNIYSFQDVHFVVDEDVVARAVNRVPGIYASQGTYEYIRKRICFTSMIFYITLPGPHSGRLVFL